MAALTTATAAPEFTLSKRNVSVLAGGTGKARLRLVVEGCQADIVLFSPVNKDLANAAPLASTFALGDAVTVERELLIVPASGMNVTTGC